jgi:hypothetical protein
MKSFALLVCASLLCVVSVYASEPITIVACAPGYPGDTEQAQPTMDDLAALLGKAMELEPDRMSAVYHSDLTAGLARLAQTDAAVALVPLPFFLRYREQLKLRPIAQAHPISGATEVWSLVAGRGALKGPSSLAGWEVTGMPGYAPAFVRKVALADWGTVPDEVPVSFTARAVSALRKAAAGDKLAVLLDSTQTEALPALPFSKDLEVVASSHPLPASLVCAVGDRLAENDAAKLVRALLGLGETESGRDLLVTLRMTEFHKPDMNAIGQAERAFDGVAE